MVVSKIVRNTYFACKRQRERKKRNEEKKKRKKKQGRIEKKRQAAAVRREAGLLPFIIERCDGLMLVVKGQ